MSEEQGSEPDSGIPSTDATPADADSPPEAVPPTQPLTIADLRGQAGAAGTPTVFQALGMGQNRKVLFTFVGVSLLVLVTAFGVFFAGRELIPVLFPSVSRYDSPIYACAACVVASQAVVFAFYFWAWKHDVAEEQRERERETGLKLKHD
jgi:hypothetical protein